MDPDAVLTLFDSVWFHFDIFRQHPQTSPSPQPNRPIQQNPSTQSLRTHTRSKSHDEPLLLNPNATDVSSPDSVIIKPSLQTILSDKEFSLEIPKAPQLFQKPNKGLPRNKKALSKSLSELEFEELKGFMDLGFIFSEQDKDDSSLVEIIPGLQRFGQKADSKDNGQGLLTRITRPYLSEAWQGSDCQNNMKEDDYPLMKWSIPAANSEIDMKDSLKWWAHTVASAVR